ncbi:hypothetical protein [Dactylosporangium sp. CS-033363]|uniref:hypothetical protein n=1 Tax=Dactylosporangium sp. CS-033363 TaxID=3239935 RepID=UPI003D8EF973
MNPHDARRPRVAAPDATADRQPPPEPRNGRRPMTVNNARRLHFAAPDATAATADRQPPPEPRNGDAR